MRDLLKNKKFLWILAAFIVVVGVIVAVTDPIRFQILITSLSEGSFYALAALGIGLLFGVLRLVNFAYGDWVMLAGYALIVPSAAVTSTLLIGSFFPALVVICIVGFTIIVALMSEAAVFRPLRNTTPPTMMIASFALGYVLQNLIIMIYGGRPKSAGIFPELLQSIDLAEGVSVPLLKIVTIVVTAILRHCHGIRHQRLTGLLCVASLRNATRHHDFPYGHAYHCICLHCDRDRWHGQFGRLGRRRHGGGRLQCRAEKYPARIHSRIFGRLRFCHRDCHPAGAATGAGAGEICQRACLSHD